MGGRLVEQPHLRAGLGDQSRQCQPCQFAARQARAAFRQSCMRPAREHRREAGLRHHPIDGGVVDVGAPEADVVTQACGEHVRTLRQPADVGTRDRQRGRCQRPPADAHRARHRRDQSTKQRQHHALAAPARPCQRHPFARRNRQRKVVQHRRAVDMGKVDCIEAQRQSAVRMCVHRACCFAAGRVIRLIWRIGRRLQRLQARERREAVGAVVPRRREFAQRLEKGRRQQQDEQPRCQIERRAPTAERQLSEQVEADIHRNQRHAERREELQHRRGQEGQPHHAESLARVLRTVAMQRPRGRRPGAEGAQRGHAAQAVEQKGVEFAELDHLRLGQRLRAPADQRHEQRNQRRRHQQHQRREPRLPRHRAKNHRQYKPHLPLCGAIARAPRHQHFGLLAKHAGHRACRRTIAVERRLPRQRGAQSRTQRRHLLPCRLRDAPRAPRFEHAPQQPQRHDPRRRPRRAHHPLTGLPPRHRPRQRCCLPDPQAGSAGKD